MTDLEKNSVVKNRIKSSLPYFFGVLISILIAIYIRIIPAEFVFVGDFVRFGGNDPWYYLRIIENVAYNFPQYLAFDAYTNYPFGTEQHWAPLYAMILVTVVMIIGLGNPSPELLHTAAAYYPAVLGGLVAIPTYYAAKWAFNDRRVGVFAAFLIAIVPGQFLSRSMIGFNDHHVAEVLFSTFVAAFLIMALIKSRKYNIDINTFKNKELGKIKPFMAYVIITGIALAAYMLAWQGGVFFAFVLGVYFVIQHLIDHMHERRTEYLAIAGVVIFGIALIAVLSSPVIGGFGKTLHIRGLISGIVILPILTGLSILFNSKDLKKYYYPLFLGILFAAVVVFSKFFISPVYDMIVRVSAFFLTSGGAATIAEASPLLVRGGEITLMPLWYSFGALGIVSFFVLIYLAYTAITQKNTQEKTFLIVWSLVMIWAMLQQNRFTYYYAVNAAILSSFAGIMVLNWAGWPQLINNLKNRKNAAPADNPKPEKKKKSKAKAKKADTDNQKPNIWHVASVVLVLLVLVYPAGSIALEQASRGTGGPGGQWIDAMEWLRYHTPDTGVDYLESYEIPEDGIYDYPDTAYGVMSWWDYGHWITAIGHRIPHANPFQQGAVTAGEFFTAPSEEAATEKLYDIHPDPDKAAARYVISDIEMATGKFHAMAAWTGDTDGYYVPIQTDVGQQMVPSQRYYNSMEARLHIFDADGMERYRMVYESPQGRSQEVGYKYIYNVVYGGNVPEEDTGYVKIFEFVEGATITGEAPEGTEVTISNTIRTNQYREFSYSQTMTSDGTFSFTVPYSTTGPIDGETQFETMPRGPYIISFDDTQIEVDVSERDVLDGTTIEI